MSSRSGHMTTEIVFGQMLALWLGDGDEHRVLESDTTGLNVKGNLYLYHPHENEVREDLYLFVASVGHLAPLFTAASCLPCRQPLLGSSGGFSAQLAHAENTAGKAGWLWYEPTRVEGGATPAS